MSEELRLVEDKKLQLIDESKVAARIRDRHGTLCLRLCQAMILIGEKIASQRDFLERAKVSRSNAFNVIRGHKSARPPSAKTMSKLAASCMSESPVPWSPDVSTTIADSLLPALRSPTEWREWRDKNLTLVAFADRIAAPGLRALEQETVAGGAVVAWLVGLGDFCGGSDESARRYRDTCHRLVTVLSGLEEGGPFVQWVQFHALQDQYVVDWNFLTDDEQGSDRTRKRFEPLFRLLYDYIEAGNPTLVAEHMNALVFASRFKMVGEFPLLRERLEHAWRRHNGGAIPDYTDTALFDADFDPFREWLQTQAVQRLRSREMPTIAETLSALALASRFKMVGEFPLLRERLEQTWRRHNGGAIPDYTDTALFDADFDPFREWLQTQAVQRLRSHDMPTTVPSPPDRSKYQFLAVESAGDEWKWSDDKTAWVRTQRRGDADTLVA